MSEKLKKVLQVISYVVMMVTVVLVAASSQKYGRRLFRHPLTNVSVENPDSVLLNRLVNKSQFSRNWWWDVITTHQGDHPQYNPNINEFAIRSFLGYHSGHKVRFTHFIDIYNTASNEIDINPMWTPIGANSLLDHVLIPIPQDSTFLPPNCYIGIDKTDKKTTRCVLAREDGGIQERIELDIYGETSTEVISQLVNNIVMVFEEKESIIQ